MRYIISITILMLFSVTFEINAKDIDQQLTDIKTLIRSNKNKEAAQYANDVIKNTSNISTSYLSELYKYKGYAEYHWSTTADKVSREKLLQTAIKSYEMSYAHYSDPQLLLALGKYKCEYNILTKQTWKMEGLIDQFDAILTQTWDAEIDSSEILTRIKGLIWDAIDFSIIPEDSAASSGRFLSYIIRACCDLAIYKNLIEPENKNFINFRLVMAEADNYNVRSNEWRRRGINSSNNMKRLINDEGEYSNIENSYNQANLLFQRSLNDGRDVPRKIEMEKELADLGLALCSYKNFKKSNQEQILFDALDHAGKSYRLLKEHEYLFIDTKNVNNISINDIKFTYGRSIHDMVQYLYGVNKYERALIYIDQIYNQNNTFHGIEYQPIFKWEGYSDLPLLFALCAINFIDNQKKILAYSMAEEAWDSILEELKIQVFDIETIDKVQIEPLLRVAIGCYEVYNRYGHELKKIFENYINLLKEKSNE